MKSIYTYSVFFLLMIAFLLQTPLLVSAADTAGDDVPKVLTYTYTDDDPTVNAPELFLSIYEETCDIQIIGERAVWTFFYENIFRSTGKWHPFSAAVTVKPLAETDVHADIQSALTAKDAYYIDFADGDLYPGTAQVEIRLSDVVSADQSYTVYDYKKNADGTASLRQMADHMKLSADGTWFFTLTEAHDLLITVSDETTAAALSAYAYVPQLAAGTSSGASFGENIGWIIFFTAVSVGVIILVLYFVTVHMIKIKRRKNKTQNAMIKK
ncbi:MAG: hypothetical protein J6I50_11560 [Clostridia bacterium]|nr:hypothetical protein [Clostridia bacterium]